MNNIISLLTLFLSSTVFASANDNWHYHPDGMPISPVMFKKDSSGIAYASIGRRNGNILFLLVKESSYRCPKKKLDYKNIPANGYPISWIGSCHNTNGDLIKSKSFIFPSNNEDLKAVFSIFMNSNEVDIGGIKYSAKGFNTIAKDYFNLGG
ncbi:hypothetical protein N9R79_07190 [Vibrio sp.]|nr:hypothetical protein [Vibrio sp.]